MEIVTGGGDEEAMDITSMEHMKYSKNGRVDGQMVESDSGCDILSSQPEYTIATHFVKVKRSGTLTDVTTLWDLVGTEAVSGSLESVLDTKPGLDRLPSINAFDKVCRYN